MKVHLDVAIVYDIYNIDFFKIEIATTNRNKIILIKERLEIENLKIINILKRLREQGEIKSFKAPKNRYLNKELKSLLRAKRNIIRSLEIVNKIGKFK